MAIAVGSFDQLDARDRRQQFTGGIIDVVVAADVTGVVVGHFLVDRGDRDELFVLDELRQKLGVVHYLIINPRFAAKLHVFVLM